MLHFYLSDPQFFGFQFLPSSTLDLICMEDIKIADQMPPPESSLSTMVDNEAPTKAPTAPLTNEKVSELSNMESSKSEPVRDAAANCGLLIGIYSHGH